LNNLLTSVGAFDAKSQPNHLRGTFLVQVNRPGEWRKFIMAKGNQLNTTQAEIKAVAKAVGASLKRDGHKVPHTAVLNALAAALNKRDWNTLLANTSSSSGTLAAVVETEGKGKGKSKTLLNREAAVRRMLDTYSKGTWTLLRLAFLEKGNVPRTALPEDKARAYALAQLSGFLNGVLRWGGWNVPAPLDLAASTVGSDLVPDASGVKGTFSKSLRGTAFSCEVGYESDKGWFLTAKGAEDAVSQLEALMPAKVLQDVGLYRDYVEMPGEPVPAVFHTDDHAVIVNFDARPYLMQARYGDILAIIECEFGGDYPTDAVADWEGAAGGNREVAYGFEHLNCQSRDLGFECRVNGEAMLTWLAVARPQDLANALCKTLDVDLGQAQEEEIFGRWDWLFEGGACDMSFETRDEATMDAFHRCNLLEVALESAPADPVGIEL
jgi:hypothetical protein